MGSITELRYVHGAPLFVAPSFFREFLKNIVKFSIFNFFQIQKRLTFDETIFVIFAYVVQGRWLCRLETKSHDVTKGFCGSEPQIRKIVLAPKTFWEVGGLNLPHCRVGFTTELHCMYSVPLFVDPSIFREFLKNVKNLTTF